MSTTDDFNQILADLTRTLSYQVVTKSVNGLTGDETSTYATATNKAMIFFLNQQRWIFEKEGLTEVGDAYVMAPTATGIKRYDKFVVDGITYVIEKTLRRYILGTATYDYGICFKVA